MSMKELAKASPTSLEKRGQAAKRTMTSYIGGWDGVLSKPADFLVLIHPRTGRFAPEKPVRANLA